MQMARSRYYLITYMVMLVLFPVLLLALQFLFFGPHSLTVVTEFREAIAILCTTCLGMMALRHVRKIEKRVFQLWRSKERCYEMISHDLKNPIGAILMSTELLIAEVGNKHVIDIIRKNAQSMADLIESLLLSYRLTSGRLTLNLKTLSIREIVAETVALLEPFIFKKQIKIVTDIEADLKCYADSNRLQQILCNLITNAVKYSPIGSFVTLKAYRRADHRAVHFVVQDTGPGIAKDLIENIFEPYVRDDVNPDGHGLGLAIVKQLVNEHGGVVWVESVVGRGSKFYFKLPDQKSISLPKVLRREESRHAIH